MGGRPWTDQEIEDLRRHHVRGLLFADIARALKPRTRASVKSKANKLGLICDDWATRLERGKAASGRYRNKGTGNV